jgi:hypothetical protein
MKKTYSLNHPAVQAYYANHPDQTPSIKERRREVTRRINQRKPKTRNILDRIQETLGVITLLMMFPTIAWLGENNAPAILSLWIFFSMIGFSTALLMGVAERDNLS